jgi:hypothetical protein
MKDLASAASRGDTLIEKGGRTVRIHMEAKYDTINTPLNGKVIYVYGMNGKNFSYDKNRKVSKKIFKQALRTDSLTVTIAADSLKLGETFSGRIWLDQRNYKILLTSPYEDVMNIETADPDSNVISIMYPCNRIGEFKFEGDLEYASGKRVHFQYNFVVQ